MLNMLGINPEEIKRYLGLAYNELIRIRRAQERQAEALEKIVEHYNRMERMAEERQEDFKAIAQAAQETFKKLSEW